MNTQFKQEIELIRKDILDQMKLKNIYEVIELDKICINMGIKECLDSHANGLEYILNDLKKITLQKPLLIKAANHDDGFGIKKGALLNLKFTLRSRNKYNFLLKLLLALSRDRFFKGINLSSIDKQGNFTMGIEKQEIFYDIIRTDIKFNYGMHITLVFKSTLKSKESKRQQVKLLLQKLYFPIK